MHHKKQLNCFIYLIIVVTTGLLYYLSSRQFMPSSPLISLKAKSIRIIRWSSELDNNKYNDHRIFFHITKDRVNRLNWRQACAVESAAKHNPKRPIQVFMQAETVDTSDSFVNILSHYQNVTIILLDKVEDYFRNSPLEKIYQTAPWNTSTFGSTHFSDYIRALSIYKGGGMYMDLDFITLKRLDEKILWNFLAMVDAEMAGVINTVVHFQYGHRLLPLMMKYLANNTYDPHWLKSGPNHWSDVVGKLCGITAGKPEKNKCSDVKLLPSDYFNALPFWSYQRYFQNVTQDVLKSIENSYAIQLWNRLSYDIPPIKESDELFLSLAKEHCPLTFVKILEFE